MKERTLFYTKLIIAFFMVCWVAMVGQYVSEANSRVELTRIEEEGVEHHANLMHVIEAVVDHRLYEIMKHQGINNSDDKIKLYKETAEKYIDFIEQSSNEVGHTFFDWEDWEAVKSDVLRAVSTVDPWDDRKSFNDHYTAINNMLTLVQRTADKSNLTLDPDLSGYYLMSLNTRVIPYLMENLCKILDRTSGLIVNNAGAVSVQDKVEMLILHGTVNNLSEQMLYAYDVLERNTSTFSNSDNYRTGKSIILENQPKFLSVFYDAVVDDNRNVSAKEILDEGDTLIDNYLLLYKNNVTELNKILHQRISDLEMRRNLLILFALSVMYGVFVFYYIFRQNYLKRALAERKNIEAKENLELEVQERLAELKQQKSLFASIIENIPLAVFAKDARDGYKWLLTNKKGIELFDLDSKAVIGATDDKIFPRQQAASIMALDRSVMEGHKIVEMDDEQVSTPLGEITARIVKVPIYDENGEPSVMMSIYEDITDRQKSQARLRMLEASVENSEDTIIITDTDLNDGLPNIVYANPAIYSITGYKPEELVGKSIRMLYGDNREDRRIKSLEKSLSDGKSYHGEILNYTKEGKELWTFINIFPVPDEYGNIANFAAIKRDITREREMRNELIRSKKLAEQANQTKTDFLANMSHELRTPLNSILGMTRMLKESDIDQSQKELVNTVFQSSVNLLEIVNDILDLSKIEAGEVQLENIGFDLPYLLKHTTQAIATLASEKKLTFRERHEIEGLPFVMGDPTRLNRIVQNLLGNAVKYTLEGYVEIHTFYSRLADTRIEWVCEVIDSGIGIPEDKIEHIFDKFTQADISTTRKFGGTGLGLTITRELIEMMDGVIEVESEVGKGSVFRVKIPFDTTDIVFKEKSRRKDGMNKGTKSPAECAILVAEDHPMNKLLVQKMFEKMGLPNYKIVENGIEVLKALDEKEYDVIFMDCHMPEKNGYDTTEDIRRLEKGTEKHIPIIAMTANAMVGDREVCIRCGMDDYISKPIDMDELYNIISQWVKFPDKNAPKEVAKNKDGSDDGASHVDFTLLNTFTNGDKEMEKEFINLYLTQSDINVQTMRDNRLEGENHPWSEAAHQFKGGSANMGAEALRALCEKGQHMLVGTKEEREALFGEIDKEYKIVKDFLQSRIA